MKRYPQGLVVGKFSPLHKGHELLLSRAQAACDQLAIISYSNPEFKGCGSGERRRWLNALFPSARLCVVDEALLAAWPNLQAVPGNDDDALAHRHFVAELCQAVLQVRVDAIFSSEDYGPGFAAELTACYRKTEAAYPEIVHVAVDPTRHTLPISGTQLRKDVHAGRAFLSPLVYTSFVERVVLLGGESSGKTTLAQALAHRFATEYVPEYGRERYIEQGGELSEADLLLIAHTQVEREERAAARAQRFLFCDTSPLTTRAYSLDMFDRVNPELEALSLRNYDVTIVCAPNVPFVQDGTRRDAAFRQHQHETLLHTLKTRNIPYLLVTGDLTQRVQQVVEALRSYVAS